MKQRMALLSLAEYKETLERLQQLRALCARATEVLEKYTEYPIGMVMSVTLRESGRSVLAELRKAAE